jgi:hypothetical protein
VAWGAGPRCWAIEVWTESEWAALADWERPDNAQWLPGTGHVALVQISEEESGEIARELWDAQAYGGSVP